MLSMWNPVDAFGGPLHSTPSGHGHTPTGAVTMESRLCLLPDQLGIFMRYGLLIGLTVLAIVIRAILTPILHLEPFSSTASSPGEKETDFPLLPTTKQDLRRSPSTTEMAQHRASISNSSTSSTHSNPTAGLAPRSSAARTRSVSPAKGYGLPASQVRFATPPLMNGAGSYPSLDKSNGSSTRYLEDFGKRKNEPAAGKQRTPLGIMWREVWKSTWRVTWVAVLVYLYLARYG